MAEITRYQIIQPNEDEDFDELSKFQHAQGYCVLFAGVTPTFKFFSDALPAMKFASEGPDRYLIPAAVVRRVK